MTIVFKQIDIGESQTVKAEKSEQVEYESVTMWQCPQCKILNEF